jgi:hypothetical protein
MTYQRLRRALMLAREEGKVGGGGGEESRLTRSSYFLDYVIRSEVFCVGEVVVKVFML